MYQKQYVDLLGWPVGCSHDVGLQLRCILQAIDLHCRICVICNILWYNGIKAYENRMHVCMYATVSMCRKKSRDLHVYSVHTQTVPLYHYRRPGVCRPIQRMMLTFSVSGPGCYISTQKPSSLTKSPTDIDHHQPRCIWLQNNMELLKTMSSKTRTICQFVLSSYLTI